MKLFYNGKKIETKKVKPESIRQKSADWMDQMVQENIENEDIRHLFGKPLNLQEPQDFEYQMTKTLKNAGYVPSWIELQHEIRDQIRSLIGRMGVLPEDQIDAEINEINLKIRKFNQNCPTPNLQKSPIFKDSINQQYNKSWL